jgi:hypothetical protein
MNDAEPSNLSKIGAGGRATAAMYPARTTCRKGHPLTPENTYSVKACPRLCRTCQRMVWKRQNKEANLGAGTIRKIFALLHEGEPLCAVSGVRNGKYIGGALLSSTQLNNFLKKNSRIAKRMRKLGDTNRAAIFKASRERRRIVAAPAIMANDGADAYEAIMQATNALWDGERGDVISLMFLAAAEGRLLPRDAVKRMPEFLREHRRQFSKFGPDSLDRPLFEDGAMTLGDTITTGLWQ